MKRTMLVLAMVALLTAVIAPAVAQVAGEVGQESQSGDLQTNFDVSNEGDYASQCTPAIQFGNTGNFNNGSSFVQYNSTADDFQPEGIDFSFEPEQTTACDNTIQQSSAASG